jgi:hypothetical protein
VRLAAGDVNGDRHADIAVAAGPGGGGQVVVFDGATGGIDSAFSALAGYTGEVNVAMGDVNGDGKAEVITALTGAFGTFVEAFNGQSALVRAFFAPTAIGQTLGLDRTNGVAVVADQSARVAAADINGDGLAEILLADPPGTGSTQILTLNNTGGAIRDVTAIDPFYNFGVYVDL